MICRSLAAALMLSIGLVALPGAVEADHAGDFLNDVRERLQALHASLENIAERARADELDAAIEALNDARSNFAQARDDIRDLAPKEARLLQAFFDGMTAAADEHSADDLTALAQSAASAMDDILALFDDYAETGTTVEMESARIASGASATLALFIQDVPPGFAGFEIAIRFDPERIRVDQAELRTGRGATRIDPDAGRVSFNGVAVDVAAQRVPPDVLALGTLQITAIGASAEATLATDIGKIVDLDGNRLPALDLDGTVTIP